MTKILVIRHGNSVTNATRRYTGQLDAPLSDLGREQAELLADYLASEHKIDAIYASDLSRAVDTIAPTAKRLGLAVQLEPALREVDVGDWTGVSYEEVAAKYPDLLVQRRHDPTCRYPGGETELEVFERVSAVLARLLAVHKGKTVVLVTHALPARIIEALSAGHTAERVRDHRVPPNAAVRIYTYRKGRLISKGPNIVSHLETPGVTLPTELV